MPCPYRRIRTRIGRVHKLAPDPARGPIGSARMKQAMQKRTGRQIVQIALEIWAETSQCRNRRVCETFNYETRAQICVRVARAIRCFFSSLIEHNHFAEWYLAQRGGKAPCPAPNMRWMLGNKIASVNRQLVTQDGNVLRASSDTKRRRRRKFVARLPDLGDHNRIELWHALRRG